MGASLSPQSAALVPVAAASALCGALAVAAVEQHRRKRQRVLDPPPPDPGHGSAAPVRPDLTADHFKGYVRRDEYWPTDSPEYRAGTEIHNRKKPPLPELAGDVFDRQRVICGFDQGLVERQTCLVLGCGGIGQNVALTLARLGVARIILLDRDQYDVSNLTRQCLGGPAQVGRAKVDVAKESLERCHNLRSTIDTVNSDAVRDWATVCRLAKGCDVIFNAIDVGPMWDLCVSSLALELQVPLVQGQSFAWTFNVEYYSSQPGAYSAQTEGFRTRGMFEVDPKAMHDKGGFFDRLVSFLASSAPPASMQVLLNSAGDEFSVLDDLMVDARRMAAFLAQDSKYRCSGPGLDAILTALLGPTPLHLSAKARRETAKREQGVRASNLDADTLAALAASPTAQTSDAPPLQHWQPASQQVASDVLAFVAAWHDATLDALAPGAIGWRDEVLLIPRPKHAETRFIGSWVCPCLAAGVLMVSQWVSALTGPEESGRDPTSSVTFQLDQGLTAEESMAYAGIPMSREDRQFASSPGDQRPGSLDRKAALLAMEQQLFVGLAPAWLAPVSGQATAAPPTHSWILPQTPEQRAAAAAASLHRGEPLSALGSEYADVVNPGIPALDAEVDAAMAEAGDESIAPWPPQLGEVPLMKVPQDVAARYPSSMRGVASGVRSAVVRVRGEHYRLKGCGNHDQGFIVEVKGQLPDGKPARSMRGCCFPDTAQRELHMAGVVDELMRPHGFRCGNQPVGLYTYAAPQSSSAASAASTCDTAAASAGGWPLPKITRCCAVFRTVGDRRLGDHLLCGLERLLSLVCPLDDAQQAALGKELNRRRGINEDEALCTTDMLICFDAAPADLVDVPLPETAPPSANDFNAAQGTDAGDPPVATELREVWDEASQALATAVAATREVLGGGSLLLFLAWRLGRDCGKVQRILTDGGVSWGTYPDSMGTHCNAHVNNMVVVPNTSTNAAVDPMAPFLAPVDHDMAFTREAFLFDDLADKFPGFARTWSELLVLEREGFFATLAGSDFASTGVANTLAADMETDPRRLALRDTVAAGFRSGFDQPDNLADPHFVSPSEEGAAHVRAGCDALVRLALVLTARDIA